MKVTDIIIPAGTPVLRHDGSAIIARFRKAICGTAKAYSFRWPVRIPVSAWYRERIDMDAIDAVMFSAHRVFQRGPFHIWQMDQPVPMRDWERIFDEHHFVFPDEHPTRPVRQYREAETVEAFLALPISKFIRPSDRDYFAGWAKEMKLHHRLREEPQPQQPEGAPL